MPVELFHGDCLNVLKTLPNNSIDSCVTDPPYGLSNHAPQDVVDCLTAWLAGQPYVTEKKGFMNNNWDGFCPGPEIWKEVLRVLKPGGHLLCFAGTRSMDLMSMAIRLAGFELRDSIGFAHDGGTAPLAAWVQAQGMPKGQDISKAIDKSMGAKREVIGTKIGLPGYSLKENDTEAHDRHVLGEFKNAASECAITAPATDEARQWEGWNTTLKPSWEPILIARKPIEGTIVENILKHGVGALNVDACRIPIDPTADASQLRTMARNQRPPGDGWGFNAEAGETINPQVVRTDGRFPTNVIHDNSTEVLDVFAAVGEKSSGKPGIRRKPHETFSMAGNLAMTGEQETGYGDTGSVARFFMSTEFNEMEKSRLIYCPKAKKRDRAGSKHSTIKPVALMNYLVKLCTPPGGTVLDPFAGTGTTGEGAINSGFNAILIEREEQYVLDCFRRLGLFISGDIQKVI